MSRGCGLWGCTLCGAGGCDSGGGVPHLNLGHHAPSETGRRTWQVVAFNVCGTERTKMPRVRLNRVPWRCVAPVWRPLTIPTGTCWRAALARGCGDVHFFFVYLFMHPGGGGWVPTKFLANLRAFPPVPYIASLLSPHCLQPKCTLPRRRRDAASTTRCHSNLLTDRIATRSLALRHRAHTVHLVPRMLVLRRQPRGRQRPRRLLMAILQRSISDSARLRWGTRPNFVFGFQRAHRSWSLAGIRAPTLCAHNRMLAFQGQ